MPTGTFYRLPEEKRERILTAIRGELARVPYETGLPGTLPLDHASPTGAQSCPCRPGGCRF